MISSDAMNRLEDLSAGRALGMLDEAENFELVRLLEDLGMPEDFSFEMIAASLEIAALETAGTSSLPGGVAKRLHAWADDLHTRQAVLVPIVPAWRRWAGNPFLGWAAAGIVALIAIKSSNPNSPEDPLQADASFRESAKDLIEWKFSGLGEYADSGGTVIWSDRSQKGYMTLNGIPVNNPAREQYQLWIVDPKRDEAPVDGGVFDIAAKATKVVIPIHAKLALTNPQAFVITIEQPGGVVKSKQERVVALAKG